MESLQPLASYEEFSTIYTGSTTGLIFMSIQITLLGWRWRQLRQRLR
jgi:hypothetical protein